MNKKEERAKQRMYDSQRAAIWELRYVRELHGLSQREVAKRMGSAASVICEIENGKTDLRMSTLRRYALACGGEITLTVSES